MPQFADLVRHSILLARASNDNDNDTRIVINDDDTNDDSDHLRLEIGVIIAIVVAGLAIIGFIVACILKRRKRKQKRMARQEEHDITWYGAEDDVPRGINGRAAVGVALGGGQEGGVVGGKAKKVAFAFAHEGEAPPPSYEVVVKDSPGASK
ncbi:hypothetical protein N0V83_008899 [Neocucurbitaria cava]|uniref:Transmembrane protein TMEM132 C-terminal domain-containing protein n=1 Tax=Neocucurbitaria cava TaxID=798079 RepID=A0A9W9CJ42_9PLEO|nr:hypothetical protein N0V83_008899 [Neocucurbitaria cava]